MRISRCVNCMEKIEAYPCPYCGCEADQSGNKDYALPCGTILQGRYLVGRVLGRGGFGITYIGLDLALETKVAIKEFYPNGQVTRNLTMGLDLLWNEDEQTPQMRSSGMETFLREARKMAKVDRIPEVVRVRDTFLSNETAYIIMDFVDGETLKSRLERKGVLSWEEAERIFFPAISAMEKVHQAGLIHRDLSPDNLMLQPDGSVSILDLGAAKDLKASSGLSSMQVAKSGFSPIEQYTQRGGSGPWTDVYSMAATMYYALTGVLPPTAVDRVEEDTLRWDLPSLNALPENVRTALRSAMQVFAKSRTQSMAEFQIQLDKEKCSTYTSKTGEKTKTEHNKPARMKKGNRKAKVILVTVAALCAVAIGLGFMAGRPAQKSGQTMAVQTDLSQETIAEETTALTEEETTFATLPPIPPDVKKIEPVFGTIDAGVNNCVALKEDGSIICSSGQLYMGRGRFSELENKDIAQSFYWPYGCPVVLKTDGTVCILASSSGDVKFPHQTNIVQLAGNKNAVYALKTDGTMERIFYLHEDVANALIVNWDGLQAISMDYYSVGQKRDGTVVIAGDNPPDVSGWSSITAVSTADKVVAGIRSDGTIILAFGDEASYDDSPLNMAKLWTDIVAVSVGEQGHHIVGLRADGTVVAAGDNKLGECDVSDWTDIVAVSAGFRYTVGLKSDGTVVSVGASSRPYVSDWRNIRTQN